MATTDDLRSREEQLNKEDQAKKERIEAAIEAREHADKYQQDSSDANRQADEAEQAIDNPSE